MVRAVITTAPQADNGIAQFVVAYGGDANFVHRCGEGRHLTPAGVAYRDLGDRSQTGR
ncbi:hypothetical protein [Streptomyces sp. NPDC054783]